MNTKAIQRQSEKLHTSAIGKMKVVKIDGAKYVVWFNPNKGSFETTMPDMTEGPTWNTRQITVACKWLREYFAK